MKSRERTENRSIVNVLLVEDNPGDVRLMKEMLAESGSSFDLLHSERLKDAIGLVEQEFDIVLLDLNLPDSRGLDSLTRLRNAAPEVPIIVLTSLADFDMGVEAVRIGAQDYLVKGSIDSSVVVRAVSYAIERKRLENEAAEQVRLMRFLAESAIDLLSLPLEEEFYAHFGRTLLKLVPDAVIVVNELHQMEKKALITSFECDENSRAAVIKLLGRDPVGMAFSITDMNSLDEMVEGSLARIGGSISELSFLQMPAPLAKAIENDLSIAEIFVIPLSIQDDFKGTVGIIRRVSGFPRQRAAIEAYVGQAAIALRRRRAEEIALRHELELQLLNEKLEEEVEARTAELARTVKNLEAEILERRQIEIALAVEADRVKQLSRKILAAEETERKRIALELHDGIAQSMIGIKLRISAILTKWEKSGERPDTESLTGLLDLVQDTIIEVRRIQKDLRPLAVEDVGLLASIRWYMEGFREIYPQTEVMAHFELTEDQVPEEIKMVIYRIVQEAMHNVSKHSQADSIVIHLNSVEDHLELTISDNGCGFNVKDAWSRGRNSGLGLTSMTERTELSGGIFVIESKPASGTTVRASWPISQKRP